MYILHLRAKCRSSSNIFVQSPTGHYATYQLFHVVSIASCSSFVCLSASCVSYSLDVARYVFKNKAGKMPTSKRKMNRKQWKQPEIIGKRQNDRFGIKVEKQGFAHPFCFVGTYGL